MEKIIFIKGHRDEAKINPYIDVVNKELVAGWIVKSVTAQFVSIDTYPHGFGGFLVVLQKD